MLHNLGPAVSLGIEVTGCVLKTVHKVSLGIGCLLSTAWGCSAVHSGEASPSMKAYEAIEFCDAETYRNSEQVCVLLPVLSDFVPLKASAKCRENVNGRHWYSFSQTRRGACAGHGGVLLWCSKGRCDEVP